MLFSIRRPEQAYYHQELKELVLPYEAVQQAEDPPKMLMDFLQSTYEAAANRAEWDKKLVEQVIFVENKKGDNSAFKKADGNK